MMAATTTDDLIVKGNLLSNNSKLNDGLENDHRGSVVATGESQFNISVVIPVYNQEMKISMAIARIREVLSSIFLNYELIIVDDGSQDNTLDVLKKEKKSDPHLSIISYVSNRGKGHAVRKGVLQSSGNIVIFMDGDLEISPKAIKDYINELKNYHLVIGSKAHPLSEINVPTSRRFLSKTFHLLVRAALGIKLKDTQSGLKAGNGEALRKMFRTMLVNRFAFDVELLTIATFLNLSIKEMPIVVSSNHALKARDIQKMLLDILAISYRYRIKRWYQKRLLTLTDPKKEPSSMVQANNRKPSQSIS